MSSQGYSYIPLRTHLLFLHLPIAAFANDLDLKVVDATGRWDGVGGPHRGGVFRGLPVTCRSETKTPFINNIYPTTFPAPLLTAAPVTTASSLYQDQNF